MDQMNRAERNIPQDNIGIVPKFDAGHQVDLIDANDNKHTPMSIGVDSLTATRAHCRRSVFWLEERGEMRSELVHSAELHVTNRFLLAATVFQAVRKLHAQAGRVEDTTNTILADIGQGRHQAANRSAITPAPAIEPLLTHVA
jgi:hypothetical protein